VTGPSEHDQEALDRWLANQHDDLRNGLERFLDPGAGLRETMLRTEHSGLLGALDSRLDPEAGLAAILQPPPDPPQQPPRSRLVTADEPLTFALRVDSNPYLTVGEHTVNAIIQVAAAEPDPDMAGGAPLAAEIIIIDASTSMTGSRIEEARRAASAAVDVVRDGAYFAVIAGHASAELVYPPGPVMVAASARSRAAAKRRIEKVTAGGTTNMSTWLGLADTLLSGCPAQIKHAIMLTDGHSTDAGGALAATLQACQGRFVCDCRGVGDSWRDDELRQIAHALRGTWAPVAAPEDLADDFRAVLTASMAKRVPDVRLRIRLAGQARVSYFAQVMPSIEDLTGKGVVVDGGQAVEFPLGHWGAQVHDYHLRLEASQRDLRIETGARIRAARIEVLLPSSGQNPAASAPVAVQWTTDLVLSSPINPRVAGYSDQEEVASAVNAGLSAWRNGEPDAEKKMGLAVRLAHQARHKDLLERLSAIAERVSPAEGVIKLRRYEQISQADVLWASYLSEQSRYVDLDDDDG
jgi:von Willebrand factor type A domain